MRQGTWQHRLSLLVLAIFFNRRPAVCGNRELILVLINEKFGNVIETHEHAGDFKEW